MSGQNQGQPTGPNASAEDDAYLKRSQRRQSTSWILVVVAVVVIVALVGALYWTGYILKPASKSGKGPCASITGAGATFPYPLIAAWSQQYANQPCNPANGLTQVQVNYQSIGSGAGIAQLTAKTVQFGASDAPLSYAQTKLLPAPVVTMPETAGAVTVMYNIPGIKTGLNLTGPVLVDIYLGHITNWNSTNITQINSGLKIPSQAITVVHRVDGSGTTFAFTSYLSVESTVWKNSVGAGTAVNWPTGLAAKGSFGVTGTVQSTTGAIGYAELNYAQDAGVTFAKVQNPAGTFVLPTVADTQTAIDAKASGLPAPTGNWSGVTALNQAGAGTYPIATFTYLMVYTDLGAVYGSSITHDQAQALVTFLWWIVHDGQGVSAGLFYVPLPASVVTLDETAIADITYNGAALTSH